MFSFRDEIKEEFFSGFLFPEIKEIVIFFLIFSSLYDECFRKKKTKLKTQKCNSPWMTKGIKKSSKRKQK